MNTTTLLIARVEAPAPIGPVLMASDRGRLTALEFGPEERFVQALHARFGSGLRLEQADDPHGFASALRAYLDGDLGAMQNLPTDGGGTAFQRLVWAALCTIPPGATASYGEIAARIGRPSAARAVGMANGLNPISIAVPCHRVIGSSGALTGYGGGLERKRWLLAHERRAGLVLQ